MLVLNLIHVYEGQLLPFEFQALSMYQEKKMRKREVISYAARFEYRYTNNKSALPEEGFYKGDRGKYFFVRSNLLRPTSYPGI